MADAWQPQPGLTPPDEKERGRRRRFMQGLVADLDALSERVKGGGGAERIAKQHKAGKLTARERVAALLDEPEEFLEIGRLAACDSYDGAAPAAGVVTGIGRIGGRLAAVMANDATVKAGTWFPETVGKILRIQEAAMRCRMPIVYLVDSGGIYLPLQETTFPGKYGGARIFYNNSLMRRRLKIPQIAAVMGPCIAGGAYLPALSDAIFMVEGSGFMGLGGANLVKGAIGKTVAAEDLGGARMHTEVSGVAHYLAADDRDCIAKIRAAVADLPRRPAAAPPPAAPAIDDDGIEAVLPEDRRLPYDVGEIVGRIVDGGGWLEFMAGYARELLCANARIAGRPVGLIANRRGLFRQGAAARIGAVLYTETARKAAQFVEKCGRQGHPLVYLQDVTGFMVGPEAEQGGIIRAGAEMVESMACARVPKLVVTLSHAGGAGYYAMAGQGFSPDFIFSWPTARVGVMEGESAVQALFAAEFARLREAGEEPSDELREAVERTRADYERCLDAKWCAARGHVDAVIRPRDTRRVLGFCLEALAAAGPR